MLGFVGSDVGVPTGGVGVGSGIGGGGESLEDGYIGLGGSVSFGVGRE